MPALPFGAYGFGISVLVISIMIAIGGIALGVGYALNEKRLKEFGREELYQSLANGALVGGMLALFSGGGMVSGIIGSVTLANGTMLSCSSYMSSNPAICLAYGYLAGPSGYTFDGVHRQSILAASTGMLASLMALNAILGAIASVKVSFLVFSFSFNYIMAPIISEIQYVTKLLGTVIIGALAQAAVLSFVAAGTLSVILPSGLVLRSFYATRRLGGFLIALGIGLYVVLPLSYVFDVTMANAYSSGSASSEIGQVTLGASGVENSLTSLGGITNATKGIAAFGAVSDAVSTLSGDISSMINGILAAVAYFIVYTFVLPAFSLMVTGVSVRELAILLGSEAPLGMFRIA